MNLDTLSQGLNPGPLFPTSSSRQIKVQRRAKYCIVSPGCSGRVGNERLITDLPGRIRFVRLPFVQVLYVVLYCLPYGRKGGRQRQMKMPLIQINRRICKRRVQLYPEPFCWGSPPSEKFSHYHHHVAAPALRCRIYVSVFALAVYQHDPNGTPIVTARFPGSTAWRYRVRFFSEPYNLI